MEQRRETLTSGHMIMSLVFLSKRIGTEPQGVSDKYKFTEQWLVFSKSVRCQTTKMVVIRARETSLVNARCPAGLDLGLEKGQL